MNIFLLNYNLIRIQNSETNIVTIPPCHVLIQVRSLPPGSRIRIPVFWSGSGSFFRMCRFRIQIPILENSRIRSKQLKSFLDQSFRYIFIEQLYCFLYQKNNLILHFIMSDPVCFRRSNSYPGPGKIHPDPQPCFSLCKIGRKIEI